MTVAELDKMERDYVMELVDQIFQAQPPGGDLRMAMDVALEVLNSQPDYVFSEAVETLRSQGVYA